MESRNFLGRTETIIVGAGQAGLSVGRYLKECKRPFIILERTESVGSSWKNRYDSLTLDSFVKYSYLEDFPFQGDPMRQATKDEVADYLRDFARHFDIRPVYATEVVRIEKRDGTFIVNTTTGFYYAAFVVLATGPFYMPYIPSKASHIPRDVHQLHSKDYRNPRDLKGRNILIVGGGNSGAEITEELLDSGKHVFFSYTGTFKSIKSSKFSQWMAYRLGLAHLPKKSLLGKIILWYTKGKAVGVDFKKLTTNRRLTLVGRFVNIENGEIGCALKNIKMKDISDIIWATGYVSDFSSVSIPDFDPLTQKRGVTNIPGLYVLNMRWQYSKSSSHLAGVSRDARYIASHICRYALKTIGSRS